MKLSKGSSQSLGLAFSPLSKHLVFERSELIDHIELPFELVIRNEKLISDLVGSTNLILHCASLSLASNSPPKISILNKIKKIAKSINSPWIGEHIAFLETKDPTNDEIYDLGFTISPPMNEESAFDIASKVNSYKKFFDHPIILENSPIYFSDPQSNMRQDEFLNLIFENCDAGFLLDLTHLYIVAKNFSLNYEKLLSNLPLDKVNEIHLSGVKLHNGIYWDNHTSAIPIEVLECFSTVIKYSNVKAVTLEFNWISDFAEKNVVNELEAVRKLMF